MSTLPIHAARPALERALAGPKPIVVTAPTGSGKSTCLPPWIAEACGGPVLVVEPRRVACRALATFLAEQHGERLGARFGYRVRFDDRSGPDTQVCFVTPGVALNMLAADGGGRDGGGGGRGGGRGLEGYAALMLDEFHERSWELDLLVALARARPDSPRLVICSATLAAAELAAALDAERVESQGRSFPVELEYIGEESPSEYELDARAADAVLAVLAEGGEGEILVFLPGKGEIERCARELGRRGCPAPVLPVHGGLPPEQLVAAFRPTGERRVFLATNVAESSLTLPGVRTVIDSGLARMRLHRGGHSILALAIIAHDSMEQRRGRAGRVAAGRCLRLWSKSFSPREVTPPELERVDLDELVLRAASCGLEGPELARAPWLAPPPSFALDEARRRLSQVGALDAEGRLSARGRGLARLPVGADRARMLLDAPDALAGTLADLVALLEHRRPLLLRAGGGDGGSEGSGVSEARARLLAELKPGQRDEVHAGLLYLRRGDARRHGLHRSGLAEARRLADSLRERIGAPKHGRGRESAALELPEPGELAAFLLARVPELAFVRRARAEREAKGGRRSAKPAREPWANGELELSVAEAPLPGIPPEQRDPAPRAGLLLEREWLGVGRSARGRGRMLLPCSFAALDAAGLGELELREAKVELAGARVRSVEALAERRFAGVCIAKQTRPLAGEQLRRALADMILEGRKLPPLTRELPERVRDELHLWELLAQACAGPLRGRVEPPPEPPAPEPWLRERLAELGLERAAELELLADEDLSPRATRLEPLAASLLALGERAWTLEQLASDFPRIWVERDARYGCTVHLERGRVIVAPLDALARKRGEPKAELLPRYRGFSVLYQQASRRVVLRR